MSRFGNVFTAVDKYRDLILKAERYIWQNPEIAFREWKTSSYLEERFQDLGYRLVKAGNIPGFYTDYDTGRPGPKILVFGELDSVVCYEHPESDPETGAVHACGHNAQCAALLGIAAALKENSVTNDLCGSVRLCAVPAEEGIDIEYREGLLSSGIIRYYSGKAEYLYRGYFDNVDMAFMVHTATRGKGFSIYDGAIGNIKKRVTFKGVASHAASSPHKGVNALYAANVGLCAINALRETFKDEEHIRVHPIITNGGASVNAIPSEVMLETYVRGISIDAIYAANTKINRALAGAAASMGAGVVISDRVGSSPLVNNKALIKAAKIAMAETVGAKNIEVHKKTMTASTDMGHISSVMPAIHPYITGAEGTSHGKDYYITDPEQACVNSAKAQLCMISLLLSNNAQRAKEIAAKGNYPSIPAYFKKIDRLNKNIDAVKYLKNGKVIL